MDDHMADRVGFALLACIAGIALCFAANDSLQEPDYGIESSNVQGKVDLCMEMERELRIAPPGFRPPEDTIQSMVQRCRDSQRELREEG